MQKIACLGILGVILGSALGCGGNGSNSPTTFSCTIQVMSAASGCEYYEATGADAARVVASLEAGCVNQSGQTAMVVAACPSATTLGGCKTPVKVSGGADVQLYVTFFYYPPAAGSVSPTTTQQVQQLCASDNGAFVAAP
jgi:hypothetical protein